MTAAARSHERLRADRPKIGTRHSNLGAVLADLLDLAGARTPLEQALEIT